ncbi:MAG: NUDIX hydrolase [Chloroflexi bacterium]|nr:MAG: NUDIX hydrolase [Chloroflexota bacterium]
MKPWKTLSRETILDCGRWLSVEKHTVELPDGRILDDWTWVIIPDYVNVLAVTPQNEFLCFRQTKYAAEGLTLAPVGGMIDPGEDPLTSAKRELREEMGYESPNWVFLGKYANEANRGVATGYLYLALESVPVQKAHSDDLEEQEMLIMTRDEVRSALLAGEFKIASWAANVALALVYLEKNGT